MTAKGARARHGAEQAVQVPRDAMQARALRQLPLDMRNERGGGFFRRMKACRFAEDQRIDRDKTPWLLISGTAQHHAIDMRKMRQRLLDAADAAVEHDGKPRMRALEPIDALVIERR